MRTLLREISLRHLLHSPLRSALVVMGIALGVCVLAAVLMTNASLVAAFEDMVARVAGKSDLTVAGSDAGFPYELLDAVSAVEGVAHASATLEVITRTSRGEGGALMVLGVDLLGDPFFLPFVEDGPQQVVDDPLAFANDPAAILITEKLAASRHLAVGDTLTLVTASGDKDFHVRGLLEDSGPAASFGGQVVVMFLDAAQVSFGRGTSVDRIDVALAEGASRADVAARLGERVRGIASVEEPSSRTQRLTGSLWAFRNGLHVSGSLALAVGTFLILNAVSVSVAQRRREVGTLRALGLTRRRSVLLFCLEALLMAALGVAVGLALAGPLARFAMGDVQTTVSRFMMPITPAAPQLTLEVALWSAGAGLVTTLLAAYVPAREIARIDPAEALRASRATAMTGRVPTLKYARWGAVTLLLGCVPAWLGGEVNGYVSSTVLLIGATLLVPLAVKALRLSLIGALERGFGIPARLALDNVERSLARSALTVIALMSAVAMSMSVGSYVTSFERSLLQWADDAFPSDAVVTCGSPLMDRHHIALAESELDKLAGVPGLRRATPTSTVAVDLAHSRFPVHAVDTRALFTEAARTGRARAVVAGPRELANEALYEAPRVLVSEGTATKHGLAPGSRITLQTPRGAKTFEVHAVVIDYANTNGWMLMDRRWFLAYWDEHLIDAIDLYFADGADPDAVTGEVRRRLGGTPALFVTLHAGLRDEIQNAARSMFAYAKAPEWVTLIVALMGVMGTMLAVVIDRIREVGILRAIGATRRQVALSLVAEATFLGLAAALCGVVAGVPLGLVIVKVVGLAASGWSLPYVFPTETALRMSSLVVTAAAVSGFLPGRRAARLEPRDALSYE
ncbi:MAG: FtsX-like permease family protein [Polyangiales bacterium]